MVLLKEEGYRSKEIATILHTNEMSVNNWINRFIRDGLNGLQTKPGRGRKPILKEEHFAVVKAAVQQECQRLSQAQHLIEEHIGKKMSGQTLTRFLKLITAVTSE
jgi:transposase